MIQRSSQVSQSNPSTLPAEESQLQRLALLEGTARLRAAEQRVREGLQSPRIDAQPLPDAPGWRPPQRARKSPVGWVIAALLAAGGAAAFFLLR